MGSWAEEMIERGVQKGLAMGREEGRQEGLIQGRAESLLRILTMRGVHVDEPARQRIHGCTDVATLERWLERSLTATTLGDVLADLAQ